MKQEDVDHVQVVTCKEAALVKILRSGLDRIQTENSCGRLRNARSKIHQFLAIVSVITTRNTKFRVAEGAAAQAAGAHMQ